MLGLKAGGLERGEDPREVQRCRVGEDKALGKRSCLGVAVAKPGDAVVEQPPAGAQDRGELSRVGVDVCAADVLDHADRGDRVELLAGNVAVVAD